MDSIGGLRALKGQGHSKPFRTAITLLVALLVMFCVVLCCTVCCMLCAVCSAPHRPITDSKSNEKKEWVRGPGTCHDPGPWTVMNALTLIVSQYQYLEMTLTTIFRQSSSEVG